MLLLAGALALAASRVEFAYDLGLFLPDAQTPEQQILLDRLGRAPGGQLLLLALPEATAEEVEATQMALAATSRFRRILTGAEEVGLESIPDLIWNRRYLLADADFSVPGLTAALADRAAELSLFGSDELVELLGADPHHASIEAVSRLAPAHSGGGYWMTNDGARVILLESDAGAFDLAAQEALIATIAEVAPDALISGVGALGVQLKSTIHNEATRRSVIASVVMILVLLAAYRRLSVLWLAALPLMFGGLTGLAAVALVFDQVHGITLAFGFTLLGVAIDYPLHLLSHCRSQRPDRAIRRIWPTLTLGLVSTLVAYAAIGFSGARGLAQLGLFTAAGLTAAAAVTAFVLPRLMGQMRMRGGTGQPALSGFRFIPSLLAIALAGGALVARHGEVWNNNLAALSPVSSASIALDNQLRDAVGTPDTRYLIAIQGDDDQTVLAASEELESQLAVGDVLPRWLAPSTILPPVSTQLQRQANIPLAPELAARLYQAIDASPFSAATFDAFLEHADANARASALAPENLRGSALGSLLDSHLYQARGMSIGLVSLFGDVDPARMTPWLSENAPQALLIDLKAASESLVIQYRKDVIRLLTIAMTFIGAILLLGLTWQRALWALLTVSASVLMTTMGLLLWHGTLNLYHLIGLLLVGGLGLDYALFISRDDRDRRTVADTRHAVTACAASTVAVFLVLAQSAIPALGSLGATVSLGAATAYAVSRIGLGGRRIRR